MASLQRGVVFRRQGSSGLSWTDNWTFTDEGMFPKKPGPLTQNWTTNWELPADEAKPKSEQHTKAEDPVKQPPLVRPNNLNVPKTDFATRNLDVPQTDRSLDVPKTDFTRSASVAGYGMGAMRMLPPSKQKNVDTPKKDQEHHKSKVVSWLKKKVKA